MDRSVTLSSYPTRWAGAKETPLHFRTSLSARDLDFADRDSLLLLGNERLH
jgi:hypothetical protein